jgi:hypothetical protein
MAWALVMPDLSACSTLVVYTNIFRFPQSAMEPPPITGIIAANSFDRWGFGYSRTTPSVECYNAISAQHATVFSSNECDATALGASYTTWTFTGGGLRGRQGELRFLREESLLSTVLRLIILSFARHWVSRSEQA